MRKLFGTKVCLVFLSALVLMLAGCGKKTAGDISVDHSQTDPVITEESSKSERSTDLIQEADAEDMELIMNIDGIAVSVAWEDNESVDTVRELAASGGLRIDMSMYGGFEQVGSIGQSIPRNDEQTTTKAGDIVLYSGDQIVVFYGSNSWAYTRLGRITDKTEQELAEMLGNGNVVLSLEVGSER